MNHQHQLLNPGLRIALICITIALIRNPGAHGEIVADKSLQECRYAIIQNMVKRGYKVYALKTSAIYFIYSGVTYWNGVPQCKEQRFLFTLQEQSNKTAINGFAVCYGNGYNVAYPDLQIDNIIIDAFKK